MTTPAITQDTAPAATEATFAGERGLMLVVLAMVLLGVAAMFLVSA